MELWSEKEEQEEDEKVTKILRDKIRPYGLLETIMYYRNKLTLKSLRRLLLVFYTIFVPIFWIIWTLTQKYPENFETWQMFFGCIMFIVVSYMFGILVYLCGFFIWIIYKEFPHMLRFVWNWIWEDKNK